MLLTVAYERHLAFEIRVAQGELEHEAVKLGVRQQLRAHAAHVVLRGYDAKRLHERVRRAIDGDLPFLHGLQQGRLCLGRGAVYLVAQQQVGLGEHAGHVLEGLCGAVVERKAVDVGGQHVWRELHAAVLQPQHLAKRGGQCGLTHTGHVVEQDVPAGQHRHEHLADHIVLAYYDPADLPQYVIEHRLHASPLRFPALQP